MRRKAARELRFKSLNEKGPIIIDDSLPFGDDFAETLDMPTGSLQAVMNKFKQEPGPLEKEAYVGVPRLQLAAPIYR